MTYREIATILGVSHQSVWEMERSALAKAKEQLEARGLSLDDLINFLGGEYA